MNKQLSLILIAAAFSTCQLSGQTVPNSGFEQKDNSSRIGTSGWKAESDDFFCILDSNTPYKGTYSLKVSSAAEGNHFFNVELPFTTQELRKYKLHCAFKTANLDGKVQLGARVFDKNGGTITKTVFTLTEKTNQGWTTAEGTFVSDRNAAKLRIFGNLAGTGNAWFDEFSISEVPPPAKYPSLEVAFYVHEYFDIVYENSIIANKNFIAGLKAKTMYLCADSVSKEECYSILQSYTTPMLKDGHSFFTTQKEWQAMSEGKHPSTGSVHHNMPTGKILDGDIAYITIPMFISSDQQLMHQYADSLQNIIAASDRQDPEGYIIDLSKNGGGNSLPMIAGIGPLIGNGVCGYSFSGDGSVKARIYDNGHVGWDTTLSFHKSNPYQLQHRNKPVAVIYSNQTGSSGEVTAIAFIGLPNTRSFGQQTAGATTRIDNFELSDGAFLNLASGVDADRNRNRFEGPIKPDVIVIDTETAITEAKKWIAGKSR